MPGMIPGRGNIRFASTGTGMALKNSFLSLSPEDGTGEEPT
jgi:hypothetical protein